MRLASLPWYDLLEIRGALDAFWAAVADRLTALGVASVPPRLDRDPDYQAQWCNGDLLLGQACGYDALLGHADRLRVVADQFGRPTPAQDLAAVIRHIVERHLAGAPIAWGTYHFAAAGRASWCDVARTIVELQAAVTGKRPPVEAITTADYPTPAKRPANSEFDTTKLERALGFQPKAWQRGLADLVKELLETRGAATG